jgi:DNA-directed RNA polymerase
MTEGDMTVAQQEDFRAWKRRMARHYEEHTTNAREWAAVQRRALVVGRFRAEKEFYFPYFLDFRGRLYPFSEAINPQGDDLTKSMLEFANGEPLGEDGAYWLAVHLANNYANDGLDKAPLDERVAWVEENEEAILDSAANPLDGARFWTTAEKPWQFLAACFEWAGFRVQGPEYVSHLPVNMDGSCSGLQHYSALLRDAVGGEAVNLVPRTRANDIYTKVAARAQVLSNTSDDAEIARMWRGKVVRKIAKQPTMTMCYAVTRTGVRKQIQHAVRALDGAERGSYLGVEDSYQAAQFMASRVWEAIGEVVVAARVGMDFLKACASSASKSGLPLRWTSPVGFGVSQAYFELVSKKVKVHYKGVAMQLDYDIDGSKVDRRSQASAVAPNYVHSLDSAHLMSTVNLGADNGIRDWSVIHDSFGTHAGKVSLLNAVLREAFVQQYSVDWLARFREEVSAQIAAAGVHDFDLPEVPAKGSLDIEQVRHSEFFFA